MERRDRDDSERDIAPLVRPEGAFYMDTTGKSVDEVVETLKARVTAEENRYDRSDQDEAYRVLLRGQPGGLQGAQGSRAQKRTRSTPSAPSSTTRRWWRRSRKRASSPWMTYSSSKKGVVAFRSHGIRKEEEEYIRGEGPSSSSTRPAPL